METMTLQELAQSLADSKKLELSVARSFVSTMFDVIRIAIERDKLVKVKGMGTFKLIEVGARESVSVNSGERVLLSSYGKITFTPDSIMKEIVNKPFSQFETVVLNDGVEFDDMEPDASTEVSEPEILPDDDIVDSGQAEQPGGVEDSSDAVVELVTAGQESRETERQENEIEEKPGPEFEPQVFDANAASGSEKLAGEHGECDVLQDESDSAPDDAQEVETAGIQAGDDARHDVNEAEAEGGPSQGNDANEEDHVDLPPAMESDAADAALCDGMMQEKSRRGALKVAMLCVMVLVLMGASAYGGYLYGLYEAYGTALGKADAAEGLRQKAASRQEAKLAPPQKRDTAKAVPAAAIGDSVSQLPRKDNDKAEPLRKEARPADSGEKKELGREPAFDSSKYEAMDSRVRTGAYRIIGTAQVVKVKKGETLQRISDRMLGPGMECYIEVYNGIGATAKLKEGQMLKIPKLELKKKRR